MPQTEIRDTMREGFEGMIATHIPHVIRGTKNEYYNAGSVLIYFGRACVHGATRGGIILPSNGTGKFAGVAVETDQQGIPESILKQENSNWGYPVKEPVNLIVQGEIFVKTLVAVQPFTPAFYVFTDADPLNIGRFTNAAGANAAAVPGGIFTTPTNADGLAILSLHMPA